MLTRNLESLWFPGTLLFIQAGQSKSCAVKNCTGLDCLQAVLLSGEAVVTAAL